MPRLMPILLAAALLLKGAAPVYRIDTVAGSANNGDGGPAIFAQIGAIQGIAVDRLGNLYLSDTDHHRVRRVSVTGIITTVAGTGVAGFAGDNGPATAAQLDLPYGLAVDSSQNLYIADLGNNRVRKVTPDGVITTVAGAGTKGSSGDGAAATSAQLATPRNLALDAAANLYISEFGGHRVRKITTDGKIATFAGSGSPGYLGDNGPAAAAQLNSPAGLAFDRQGNLYIADSLNNCIRRVTPGGIISTPVGGPNVMATPFAVAVDGLGGIYVADTAATVVFAYSGSKRVPFAGNHTAGYCGDGAAAVKACLTDVLDLAADLAGNIYLADNMRVRRVDLQGVITTAAGDGYLHAVGDLSNATDAILHRPSAVALDAAGNLFIADTGTQRVRQVLSSGVIVTMAAGMTSPAGVAVNPRGAVFVADPAAERVFQVTGVGVISVLAGTGDAGIGPDFQLPGATQLHAPGAVCLDRDGALLVADTGNNRLLRMAPTALVVTVAGNGALNQPAGCAVDSSGNIFIADTAGHRIRRIAPGGAVTTVAGAGAVGNAGDEGPAVNAQLSSPGGVAVDAAGDLFIADTGNHLIREVTADGVIHTVAGGASAGFAGDGGPASASLLSSPGGVALDTAGNLYIADTGNDRVRRLVPAQSTAPAPVVTSSDTANPVNAASLGGGPVAPGEVIVFYGKGLGPDAGVAAAYDATGMLPLTLGGTEVKFDGASAPLFYAQAGEVHAQVPSAVSGQASTHADVLFQGQKVLSLDLQVAASAPGLYPVAVNPDGTLNSAINPVAGGATLTLYATGEGINPQVTLTIGGSAADVNTFATPGVIGMLQLNAKVPTLKPGTANVILTVGAASSQPITVYVK